MCTAITYHTADHYFGRNLDFSYNETVTVTPRNYVFPMRKVDDLSTHYAIIGMSTVAGNYPLYYDAINEKGLAMASLNFEGNAYYFDDQEGKKNITSFELIPYILGTCQDLAEAKKELSEISISNEAFSKDFPLSTLHWMIADKTGAIVIESIKEGNLLLHHLRKFRHPRHRYAQDRFG